jgi:hypothetical protein
VPVRKTLVDALVKEIRVQSRDHIVPVLRLSTGHHRPDGAVRPGEGFVAHTLSYSNPEKLQVRMTGLAKAMGWRRLGGMLAAGSAR